MLVETWSTASLWLAVVGIGIFHGLNPGMGWPLAVSAALMGKGERDLFAALVPLAGGHFLAMAVILLPFGAMTFLIDWQREIQISAALLVICFALGLLIYRRHPRFLSRIRPTQLALWSFAMATAHGAGLMLLPIYLGICKVSDLDAGHQAAASLMTGNLINAIAVAFVHSAGMIVTGGVMAFAVHRWLGMKFVSKSWFNLDLVWALSLLLVGALGLYAALTPHV